MNSRLLSLCALGGLLFAATAWAQPRKNRSDVRVVTLVALAPSIEVDSNATTAIVRGPQRDVILVTAAASGQDLADAVKMMSTTRSMNLDRPVKKEFVRVKSSNNGDHGRGHKAGSADAQRAERWLAKLATAPISNIEGVGQFRTVSFSVPMAAPARKVKK